MGRSVFRAACICLIGIIAFTLAGCSLLSGNSPKPTVTISASPATVNAGSPSTLTVSATNATQVTIAGSDNTTYTLQLAGGTQVVTPTATTTYTATAVGGGETVMAQATVTVNPLKGPTVTVSADPPSIAVGQSSTLTVTATNATSVTLTGSDNSSYTLPATGGTQTVSPAATTTYTATATGNGGTNTAEATVTVTANQHSIQHVIFMLQENHSFDNYFGMLNPYRQSNGFNIGDDGKDYEVDGMDDKLSTISNEDDEGTSYSLFKFKTTCVDDMSSDWLSSYGDISRYNFLTTRPVSLDGFVHNGEGFARSCAASGKCSGNFTDLTGQRVMGYYDEDYLNYYYYMASQFAVSDRWFSPVSSKSVDNRIATFSGGTTQGLVKDPGEDHVGQLSLPNIFQDLDQNDVSWKIYYTVTEGLCQSDDDCGTGTSLYPATDFQKFTYSSRYVHKPAADGTCSPPTQPSSAVGDSTNTFCIDPNHIAPIAQYFTDLTNGTLPSFAFIEAGYGHNDEHPGSGQSILNGQVEVAKVIDSLMQSSSWSTSAFFLSYDEGGGPYDHVPPLPGHSNDHTDAALGTIPDISSIAVDPDSFNPCVPAGGTPTTHCDLKSSDPGANAGDAAAVHGFAAQLGFRVPNFVVSPYAKRHYVSHIPMDHTAVIRFVENQFIPNATPLTARDAAQPNLLDFFDFTNIPWATPPTPPAAHPIDTSTCTPSSM
jgi:phospholipase C